jgi:hypothetical protein
MFTRHRHGAIDELDCPHALGTNAFSPRGQSHFVTFCCYHRPIRLLRCAQSLRAGSGCLPPTHADESSSQPWSGCGALSGLRVRRHAGACSPPAQRATAGYVQRWNCPTQAKRRLEWATRRSSTKVKVPTLTSKSTTLGWGTLESHAGWEGRATRRVRSQSQARVMSAGSMNKMYADRMSHWNNGMFRAYSRLR